MPFFAPFAVQAFLAVHFLTARSLRSLKTAKTAKKDRQGMSLFGPPGQPNPGFLCVLCASVVNDFTTHSLALVRGTEITEQLFFGPPGQQKNAFLRVLRGLRGSSFSFL